MGILNPVNRVKNAVVNFFLGIPIIGDFLKAIGVRSHYDATMHRERIEKSVTQLGKKFEDYSKSLKEGFGAVNSINKTKSEVITKSPNFKDAILSNNVKTAYSYLRDIVNNSNDSMRNVSSSIGSSMTILNAMTPSKKYKTILEEAEAIIKDISAGKPYTVDKLNEYQIIRQIENEGIKDQQGMLTAIKNNDGMIIDTFSSIRAYNNSFAQNLKNVFTNIANALTIFDKYGIGVDYSPLSDHIKDLELSKFKVYARSKTDNLMDATVYIHKYLRGTVEKRCVMLQKSLSKAKTALNKHKGELPEKELKEAAEIAHSFISRNGGSILNDVKTLKLSGGNGYFVLKDIKHMAPFVDVFDFSKERNMIKFFYAYYQIVYAHSESLYSLSSFIAEGLKQLLTGTAENADKVLDEILGKSNLLVTRITVKSDLTGKLSKRPGINISDDWIDNWFDMFRDFVNNEMTLKNLVNLNPEEQLKLLELNEYYGGFGREESLRRGGEVSVMRGTDRFDDYAAAMIQFSKNIYEKVQELQEKNFAFKKQMQELNPKKRLEEIDRFSKYARKKQEDFEKHLVGISKFIGVKNSNYSKGLDKNRLVQGEAMVFKETVARLNFINQILLNGKDGADSYYEFVFGKLIPFVHSVLEGLKSPDVPSDVSSLVVELEEDLKTKTENIKLELKKFGI